ncbi:MAG: hypothetical protein FJ211_00175 [Ignavibacteria bacterium]|nr:hypothetical protein [Ignavibacteria bacterium]
MKTNTTLNLAASLALLVVLISACTSPLDTTAPRNETPITPAEKITPQSYSVACKTAYGNYVVKGLPTIKIDTTTTPMRFWFDFMMDATDTAGLSPLLHSFRVRLDSFPGDGLITILSNREVQLQADFGPSWGGLQSYWTDPNSNTASIIVAEHPREAGKPRTVTITLFIFLNKDNFYRPAPQQQVLGTVTLTI